MYEPKTPGWKTTEFWITVGTALGGAGATLGLPDDHLVVKIAAIAASLIQTAVYTWARVKVKGM